MDEYVLVAVVRRDEAEAFGVIEEFDGTGLRHGKLLFSHQIAFRRGESTTSRRSFTGGEETDGPRRGLAETFSFRDPAGSLASPMPCHSSLRAGKCPNLQLVPYFRRWDNEKFFNRPGRLG